MATPFLSALSSAGGTAKGIVGGNIVNSGSLSFVREISYWSNYIYPNLVPSIDQILQLRTTGMLNSDQIVTLLKYNGVDLEPRTGDTYTTRAWKALRDLSEPRLSPSDAVFAYHQGVFTEEQLDLELKREGVVGPARTAFFKNKVPAPPLDWIRTQFFLGGINENLYNQSLSRAGYDRGIFWDPYKNEQPLHSLQDLAILHNRKQIETETLTKQLNAHLLRTPQQVQRFKEIAKAYPSISDLVQFSVREVWNQPVVDRWGYDEEFPPEFSFWAAKLGYDWSEEITLPSGQKVQALEWAKAFWRAHWQPISPTMGYAAFQRLRGNPNDQSTWRVKGVKPFTETDLNTILKIADYPSGMRATLMALSYHTLTRVDIRRLYDSNVINRQEVKEYNLDLGYAEREAERLTNYIVIDRARRKNRKRQERLTKLIIDSYQVGILTRDEAKSRLISSTRLVASGMTESEANLLASRAFSASEIEEAELTLREIDAANRIAQVKQGIASVRFAYLGRDISGERATTLLVNLGLSVESAMAKIELWKYALAGRSKHASAAQVTRWLRERAISESAALRKLKRIGYRDTEALTLIASTRQNMKLAIAKEHERLAKSSEQKVRAMVEQRKEVEREKTRIINKMLRLGTPSRLKKWFSLSLISEEQLRARLKILEYSPADIDNFVIEISGDMMNQRA